MKSRVIIVLMGFGLVWGLLLIRVFILQVMPQKNLERLKNRQYETRVQVEGRRGTIFDRKGVPLALSAPAYSLYGDPQELGEDLAVVTKTLQKTLKISSKDLRQLLKDKKKRFVWIERQMPLEKAEKIKSLKIRGLGLIEEPMRVYPDEAILKSVLGFVGRSGSGLEGVEKQYDALLKGNPKKVLVRRDAKGRPLHVNGLLVTEREEGKDLQLTIDRELQYVLHRELQKTVDEQEAAGAVGVILDAQTSEIRAMDAVGLPVGGETLSAQNWRNRPILEAFEPGSTMKPFIVAGGIKHLGWQPNTRFDCEKGQLKIGRRTIHEANRHHRFGWLTISEILSVSSNIGTAKMAFALGEDGVRRILGDFGFGQRTGVDLPGEAKGIIQQEKWSQHLLSNVSFGHGLTATPLQIANAYAVFANGGVLKVPKIARPQSSGQVLVSDSKEMELGEGQDEDSLKEFLLKALRGKPEEGEGATVVKRILSQEEAQTLRLLLSGVVTKGGTGVSATVAGYPVAGKTGTAQKVDPKGRGYLPGTYISSFVGLIPANQPQFVIYVAVDSPKKQYYGSQVAGPLFSRVATFAVRHEGLPPQWLNPRQAEGVWPEPKFGGNLLTEESEEERLEAKQQLTPNGVETVLADQSPNVSTEPGKDGKGPVVMPNLNSMTLRQLHEELLGQKLRVSIHGSGKVWKFHPEEGTPLGQNQKVEIWLRNEE